MALKRSYLANELRAHAASRHGQDDIGVLGGVGENEFRYGAEDSLQVGGGVGQILARIHEPITNHPAFRLGQNLLIGGKIDFLAGTGMTLLRRQPDGSWRFARAINNSVLAPGR